MSSFNCALTSFECWECKWWNEALSSWIYFFDTFCIYYILPIYAIAQDMPHAIPQTQSLFYLHRLRPQPGTGSPKEMRVGVLNSKQWRPLRAAVTVRNAETLDKNYYSIPQKMIKEASKFHKRIYLEDKIPRQADFVAFLSYEGCSDSAVFVAHLLSLDHRRR